MRFSPKQRASSKDYLMRSRQAFPLTSGFRQRRTVQQFLLWLGSQITFGKALLVVALFSLATYLTVDSLQNIVILDPIGVPKSFSDAGITSEVMAQRVRERILDIQRTDESSGPKELFHAPMDQSIADIEIPEAHVSIRIVEETLRRILHNEAHHLSADVAYSSTKAATVLRCRILKGDEILRSGPRKELLLGTSDNTSADADKVADSLALELTELANPFLEGMYLQAVNRNEEADQVADRMLQRWPDSDHEHAKAYIMKAYSAQGRGPKAAQIGRKAEIAYWYNIALDDAWAAIDLGNSWSYPHQALAWVYDEAGRFVEAESENLRAIEFDSKNAFAYNNLGLVLEDKRRFTGAAAEYRRAIHLKETYFDAHRNLGLVLVDSEGTIDQRTLLEASSEFRRAIQLDPTRSTPHYGLAIVLRDEGQLDEAVQEDRRAIQLDKGNAYAHNGLANILADLKRFTEAITEYNISLGINKDYCEPYNGIGEVRFTEGRLDEAADEYTKAVACDPAEPLPHHNLEQVLRKEGKPKLADAERKAAHDLDPKDSPLLLLAMSVAFALMFVAWLIYEYEEYRHGNHHTRLRYAFSIASGFSGLLCFAIAYIWLTFSVTR
jgi:tetratricopeptide (TPR) repeat protein